MTPKIKHYLPAPAKGADASESSLACTPRPLRNKKTPQRGGSMKNLILTILLTSMTAHAFIAAETNPAVIKKIQTGTAAFLENYEYEETGEIYGEVRNVMHVLTEAVDGEIHKTYFYQATYRSVDKYNGDVLEQRDVQCKTKLREEPTTPVTYARIKTMCDYVPQTGDTLEIYNQNWDQSLWAI